MNTIVRITPAVTKGWSVVRVNWTHADSLYKHFRTIGAIGYTVLKDSGEAEVCVEADSSSKMRVVVTENGFQSFEVQAYPKSLAPILTQWVNSLK